MMQSKISLEQVSDQACLIRFGDDINERTADQILFVAQRLKNLAGVQDLIPSYTSVLVTFDPETAQADTLISDIQGVLAQLPQEAVANDEDRHTVVIPVYYGHEVGPDLDDVATHCGLTPDEVIQRHSEQTYRAYAIGFTPGFSFLGNTPAELHIPRKSTPRHKVPKGSVAIAENQTAVYPSVTPGGWQILGRTPTELVDWQSDNIGLIATGDQVRFKAISKEEFLALGGVLDGF